MDADLRALGEDALAKYPDDDKQAIAWMIKHLLDNRELFEKHVVPLVTQASRSVIRWLQDQQRAQIRKNSRELDLYITPKPPASAHGHVSQVTMPRARETPPNARLIRGQRLMAEHNWLNYPVAGKPLGEHTRTSLLKSATQYLMAGHTQTVNGYFLVSVAERLTDDEKVCDVLGHTELAQMREAAERRVA